MATEHPLPTELEREIFETAALMHPPDSPSLLRVARRVHFWIEPFLYRVIRLDRLPVSEAVRQAMRAKPASFFRDSVRHLFLNPALWSADEVHALLRLCPRLESLYTLGEFSTPALLPALQGLPHLRRWGGPLDGLFGTHAAIDLAQPFFRRITHLDLFDAAHNGDVRLAAGLAALPALTHLCLNNTVGAGFVRQVLADCARLRVLVHLWNPFLSGSAREIAANPPVPDARFVVGVFVNYWDDWEVGAHGGTDFWAAADAFVAQKRVGAIEASCYWLDHFS
ncbi:hypothetical protein B0H15DRAFT_943991 [Mycena belliarum]|uniref:Uncharacterized protein n=1 Tax=Mycena belliarum TaxID=1033014 RepID=A0AAD6UEA6_9AGAR|nr:hypothetical protein B0H15DRAFT_943991 [Mycena belliae]